MRKGLTYDDVLLVPKYSNISTRSHISLETEFLGLTLSLPIISANMDYVTGPEMAKAMWKAGGLGILHRFFDSDEQRVNAINDLINDATPIAFSIGLNDIDRDGILSKYSNNTEVIVTIDVAHGHHQRVVDLINDIKIVYPSYKIIAGNVATAEGFSALSAAGADAVKVGIGPGSVCTTRQVTGVGVPQLTALLEISQYKVNNKISTSIIADGGIKNSGDIVKALAAGANTVMLGSLLAGTDEAPAPLLAGVDGRHYKAYRGQSIFGSNAKTYVPEGISGIVPVKGPVSEILKELESGIRSGMSYVGAINLRKLRANAEFIEISGGTHLENSTRVQVS